MSYRKPTLIELFAQFAMEPESFPAERFFDLVPLLRERGFESVEFSGIGVGSLRVTPDEIQGNVAPRVRCWSHDRSQVVQLAPDVVIANLVSPDGRYPGWAPFTDLVRRMTEALAAAMRSPTRFLSLALTTIDQFRVSRERLRRIDEYLRCDGVTLPTWLAGVSAPFDVSLGKGLVPADGFNRQVSVRGRLTNSDYEFRFQSVFHNRLEASQSPLALLETLHDESNLLFESLITDRVRDEVMEGEANAVNV